VLKGLDPLLSPELLHALAAMGHGDEIAIVDANFPAASTARRLIRLDGVDAARALKAILSVLPLDSFVDAPALTMEIVGSPNAVPEAVRDFQRELEASAGRAIRIAALPRHDFYERARGAYAIVATGERRFYGNVILVKGVFDPSGKITTTPTVPA
jgi:L-fucose mutarotase